MKTVLLLDADIYAFKIASVSQQVVQFDPTEEPLIVLDDWDSEVVPRIEAAIAGIKEQLGTENVIICLSCPTAENFRLDFLKTYKGNRDYSKRPEYLARIKEYMERRWPSFRRPRLDPSKAKNSHCTGTITESAATSELTVINPKEGEQSMIIKS